MKGKSHMLQLSFCHHKPTKQKRPVWSEASTGTETIQVESLINVNLPSQYQVNEVQASIHHLYNIRYVLALPLGLPL